MNDKKSKWGDGELEQLRRRIQDHKSRTGDSWKIMAGKIGIGESTLQAFATGNYKGDVPGTAEEVSRWFETSTAVELFAQDWVPGFQETVIAKKIRSILTWAQRGNMVTIIGAPGVGKSQAGEEYCRVNHNAWLVTGDPSRSTLKPFLEAVFDAIQVSPTQRNSANMAERLRTWMRNRDRPLLIVDEAQHLGERVLEQLRSLHDTTKMGIAFMGNNEVTKSIDGTRTAQFAQRSSRVSMRNNFSVPTATCVATILGAWGISDDLEAKFLTAVAMRPGGGALRQMTKVLELATLVANDENRRPNLRDIKDAAAQLDARLS